MKNYKIEAIEKLMDKVAGKDILFVSTKDKGYIRNQQEVKLLKSNARSCHEVVFSDKSYLKRILKVYFACIKGDWKQAGVVYVGFAPQLLLPFLKKWMREKYVAIDFFISLYDTFVCDRKYFKEGSVAAKILFKLDKLTLERCHYVIVDTQADQRHFSKMFHVPLCKTGVLYLEADNSIYNIQKYKMRVLYFGSVLPLQGVDVVLKAARMLRGHTDIAFTVIGPARRKSGMDEGRFPNVAFYNWLPQEKLAGQIAGAGLCIAGHFNKEIGKARRTIPGKAYIYEAMKKPMVLGDNEANRELFQEDSMHFYVEMGNARALAKKIIEVKEHMQKNEIYSHAEVPNAQECAAKFVDGGQGRIQRKGGGKSEICF